MKTFDQINDATGFANGDKWMTDEQIYGYFTTENMRRMFRDQATLTQDELDEMAEVVIENRWHMEADSEPTREQIAALQDEAAAAGDDAMVATCAAALDGEPVALAAAAQCISDAAAQRDE
jgi:hypothetical protein